MKVISYKKNCGIEILPGVHCTHDQPKYLNIISIRSYAETIKTELQAKEENENCYELHDVNKFSDVPIFIGTSLNLYYKFSRNLYKIFLFVEKKTGKLTKCFNGSCFVSLIDFRPRH